MKTIFSNRRASMAAAVCMAILMLTTFGCKQKNSLQRAVKGLLTEEVDTPAIPTSVEKALSLPLNEENYEQLYSDEQNNVSVWSLMRCSEDVSSEGYGIVIQKNGKVTVFANIRHGRQPQAQYDAASGMLLLTGADMEGTGVNVERLLAFTFQSDGTAVLKQEIAPIEIQNEFCSRLSYRLHEQDVTLLFDDKVLGSFTQHETGLGTLSEDALQIGEQIAYSLSPATTVSITPGLKFTGSEMLVYDDCPTITADIILNDNGFTLSNIRIEKETE